MLNALPASVDCLGKKLSIQEENTFARSAGTNQEATPPQQPPNCGSNAPAESAP